MLGKPMRLKRLWLPAALALAPTAAFAHTGTGAIGGFTSGFLHPILGLDHLLAMFAVGIWGTQIGGRSVWSLPVAFPMIMAIGGFLGASGVPFPFVERVIALSMIVLGAVIAMAFKPPEWVAIGIIAVFAIFHGHAHGAELPRSADPASYGIGFVLATGLIHLAGIVFGLFIGSRAPGRVARASGIAIALAGLWFLLG
jgi:urease accessory protein